MKKDKLSVYFGRVGENRVKPDGTARFRLSISVESRALKAKVIAESRHDKWKAGGSV